MPSNSPASALPPHCRLRLGAQNQRRSSAKEKFYDISASLTYIFCIFVSRLRGDGSKRGLVNSVLVVLWALRLGSFLLWRVLHDGGDSRFAYAKTRPAVFFVFWAIQALWIFITALPVYLGNRKKEGEAGCPAISRTFDGPPVAGQASVLARPAGLERVASGLLSASDCGRAEAHLPSRSKEPRTLDQRGPLAPGTASQLLWGDVRLELVARLLPHVFKPAKALQRQVLTRHVVGHLPQLFLLLASLGALICAVSLLCDLPPASCQWSSNPAKGWSQALGPLTRISGLHSEDAIASTAAALKLPARFKLQPERLASEKEEVL